MKKISNKMLISLMMGEIIVLLCSIVLTEKNLYFWILVIILFIISMITFYNCVSRTNDFIKIRDENKQKKEREQEEQNKLFFNQLSIQMQEDFSSEMRMLNDNISDSKNMFEKQIIEFTELNEKNAIEMSRKNEELVLEIKSLLEQQNADLLKSRKNEIESICSTFTQMMERLIAETNEYYSKIEIANNQIRQCIQTTTALQSEAIDDNKRLVNDIYNIVNLIEAENKNNIYELGELFDKNSLEMRVQHSNNLTDIQNELNNVMNLLSEKYIQALADMNNRQLVQIEEWKAGTNEILTVSNSNIESLMDNVRIKLLQNSDMANKVLIEQLMFTKDAVNEVVIQTSDLLQNQYRNLEILNKSLSIDTKDYTQRLMDQIIEVSCKNSSEIKTSYENVLNYIVERIITENDKTLIKRTEAFETYIKELEEVYNGFISNHMIVLSDKLKEYSDSLVEKSSIAIANVQSDNNLKLQNLSDQVSDYAFENKKFITYCQELNNDLKNRIGQMIDDRNQFVDDLNEISNMHLDGFDNQLKSSIHNMIEQLQMVNVENANLFSDSMKDYRDKFVIANANALANVQVDNINSITEANKKISELASNLKKFQDDISAALNVLNSIVSDGIDGDKEQKEEFDSSINMLVDTKLSEYNKKIQETNDYIKNLGDQITNVMVACQNNTSKYEETLRYIVEAQKEANSLNNKDVELLKSFMMG